MTGAAGVLALTLLAGAGAAITGAAGQEIHGFVEGLGGVRTAAGSGFEAGSYTARETRLQLRISGYTDDADYFARIDVPFDRLAARRTDLELREAFFTYSGGAFDVKIGRQILTWGSGDLLFINDVFPKDWQSFFIGREDQYLKAPIDALRVGLYSGAFELNLAVMPFEPDRLPTADRLAFQRPAEVTAPPEEPANEFGDGEIAARGYRALGGTEVALYAYAGYHRQPLGFEPGSMRLFYPRLRVYGAGLRRGLLGGVGNLELGYYDSRDDRDGTDPNVENSSLKWMIGFDRQLRTDLQLGVQGFYEWMQDHDRFAAALPPGVHARDEVRHLYTVRLTQMLEYQTVGLSLFAFVSPTDEDHYVRAAASYKLNDPIEVVLGANIFGGASAATLFGQLDDNDNVYLRARYTF